MATTDGFSSCLMIEFAPKKLNIKSPALHSFYISLNIFIFSEIEHLCDEVESCGRNIIKLLNSHCPPSEIAEPAMQLNVIKIAILEFAVGMY